MKIAKTDSLGMEILNKIMLDETKQEIILSDSFKKAIGKKDVSKLILFEVQNSYQIFGYFVLEEETYRKWTIDYKLKGIEL